MTSTTAGSNIREDILDAALELMAEHGAVGMSMRQLASRVGVQVAAIYHYFPSKDALLATVVAERQYGTGLGDPMPVDPDGTPADRVRSLFTAVWNGSLEEEAIWRVRAHRGTARRGRGAAGGPGSDRAAVPRRRGVDAAFPPRDRRIRTPPSRLLVGQLLAGFVRRIFEPDLDPALIAGPLIDALVDAFSPARPAGRPSRFARHPRFGRQNGCPGHVRRPRVRTGTVRPGPWVGR